MRALLSKLYAYRVGNADALNWPDASMGGDSAERTFQGPQGFVRWLEQYEAKPSSGDCDAASSSEIEFWPHRITLGEGGNPIAEVLSVRKCFSEFLYNTDKTPEAISGIRYAARYSREVNKLESYWYIYYRDIRKESFDVPAGLTDFWPRSSFTVKTRQSGFKLSSAL